MRYVLLLFLLVFGKVLSQSDLLYQSYTINDGLASNTIFDLFQDTDGYLFVANDKGINKFNGRSFKQLSSLMEEKALSNITPLGDQKLIVRNFQGDSFIIENDSISNFQPEIMEPLSFPTYNTDGEHRYVAQHSGFYYLNDAYKAVRFDKGDFEKITFIWSYVVKEDIAYLFCRVDNKPTLLAIHIPTQKTLSKFILQENEQVRLFKSNNSVFWLNTINGDLGIFTGEFVRLANLFQEELTPNTKFTHLLTLRNGQHLVSTFNGLFHFDENWKLQHHYLKGVSCSVAFEDVEGSLWVGTLQNGLYFIPSLQLISIESNALPGDNIKFSCIKRFGNSLYAGTYDGKVFQFNTEGVLEKTYDFHKNAEVQSLLVTEDQLIAFCGSLFILNKSSGAVLQNFQQISTKAIYKEADALYLSSSLGFKIIKGNQQNNYLTSYWFTAVFPMNPNTIIGQTTDGVMLFDISKNEVTMLHKNGADLCKFGDDFFFREQQQLWKVARNGALTPVKSFPEQLELIQSDENGIYGLFSNQKMAVLYPSEKLLLLEADGSWLREMVFMNVVENKFCYANSTKIIINSTIQDYQVIVPWLQLVTVEGNYTKEITEYKLPYSNNSLQFTFDLLPNYRDLGKGSVAYHLEKIDNHWIPATVSTNYQIDLVRLPPGRYHLCVVGTTSNGVTTEPVEFSIVVASPFYFTWWFILLVLGILALLVVTVIRWRIAIIAKKNQQALEKQELQLKALNAELNAIRAQMNPHFIFNSLSAIQTQILNDDKLKAFENLSTFAVLLRQALQFTSEEFLTLEQELSFISNYVALEQQRTHPSFQYIEKVDPSLELSAIKVPSLLLQPFVENSIRHGFLHSKEHKELCLEVSPLPTHGIRISIRDNGIGRKASEAIQKKSAPKHVSFATKAIYDRIDILKQTGKMTISLTYHDLPQGTEVVLDLLP